MGDVVSKRNITRVGQWEMLLVSEISLELVNGRCC